MEIKPGYEAVGDVELAQLCVRYAKLSKELAEVSATIETAVLQRRETVKIAGVVATYYKAGFETPDYESHARAVMPEDFDLLPYTTTTTSIRWRDICETLKVAAPPTQPKPARVAIKFQQAKVDG